MKNKRGYTDHPIKARIFRDDYCWNLDGVDADGHFTEECLTSGTYRDIIAWLPRFMQMYDNRQETQ